MTHGGILAAIIDLSAYMALMAEQGSAGPTIDMRVDYHRSTVNSTLYTVAKLLRVGSTISTVEVIVRDVDWAAVLLHAWPELAKAPGLNAGARRTAYERKFARAYREGVREGRLRPLNPDRAARTLLAAANSVTSWHRPATPVREAQATRDTVELLTHGFRR